MKIFSNKNWLIPLKYWNYINYFTLIIILKKKYQESNVINFLKYINSISNETSSIEITRSETIFKELESIKTSINLLKFEDSSFTIKLNLKKIKKGYKIDQIIEKSHDKLLNDIFEIDDNKILTGSLDSYMKIWKEISNKFENIKIIKGNCGAIYSMTQLLNGNILTTAGNNNIYIWSKKDKEDGYIVSQSLSSLTKSILTAAQIQNDKLITGGIDNLIIIRDKDINC